MTIAREEIDVLLDKLYRIDGIDHGTEVNYASTQLTGVYRGCGLDRWPEFAQHSIERAGDIFAPALLIYDVDCYESDGTEAKRKEAVRRLQKNMEAVFIHDLPLLSLRMLSPAYRRYRRNVKVAMEVIVTITNSYGRRDWEAAAFRP